MIKIEQNLKPALSEPFPNVPRYWKDPKTGIMIPKFEQENIRWRENLLRKAENDPLLQNDLMAACKESLIFWTNTFVMTYHQFDVDPATGKRTEARNPHCPFITWEIQDTLLDMFEYCLKHGLDILIDKCRDMGASWLCIVFLHWLWLFRPESQLLELSRTEDYVDKTGNMKALFQKHDYINQWLPDWMYPPSALLGGKNRTKMHMKNEWNNNVIDGESTTEHAASGDRRLVALLDEFAKVEKGQLMRSATRDAAYMRIVNSTPAGAGTEYSRWKKSGQIKVFVLPFFEHPEKGKGRYVKETEVGGYEIRSPWFDIEETVRSPQEMAREILRQDIESGAVFFTITNIDKHIALFARDPKTCWSVNLKKHIAKTDVKNVLRSRNLKAITQQRSKNGPLRVWTNLIMGRPDQSMSYIFGIDIGKGQGASPSVVSIKCKQTGEKIAEWRDANIPPYEMAGIVVALAIWCGGCQPHKLPFLKWEKNGPGLDFGKIIVKDYLYPYYHKAIKIGQAVDTKTKNYGFHTSRESKQELLSLYDRILAHGGYINHSREGLEEAMEYIYYTDGGIGPACLVERSSAEKKTHGDIVMADALTLDDKELPKIRYPKEVIPRNSSGYRLRQVQRAKKRTKMQTRSWRKPFDYAKSV